MKGLVLSGGMGTRFRPFTYSMPKQLVPVANKPVMQHVLERIREMGVTQIGVIVGDWADEIMGFFGDGSRLDVSLTYIRQHLPLGLAHCVAIANDFLADDDFVMYLGDCILSEEVTAEAERFRAHRPDAHVVVSRVADPAGLGVVELGADDVVLNLAEKPEHPRSNLVLTGVYFFTPAVHQAVRSIQPSARGELEITDAVQWLLDNGFAVTAGRFPGMYMDTGRIADVLECNRRLMTGLRPEGLERIHPSSQFVGPITVGPGAKVIRSRIVGPAMIGSRSIVTDSDIGPYTTVGTDCAIRGSALEGCIVMASASIASVPELRDSVIGRSAVVTVGDQGHSLIVGDECRVEVMA